MGLKIEGVKLQTNEKPLEPLLDAIQHCDKNVLKFLKDNKGITAITIVSTKEKVPSTKRDSIKLSYIGLKKDIELLYSKNKNKIVLCVDKLLDTKNIEDDTKADPEKLQELYEGCLKTILAHLALIL